MVATSPSQTRLVRLWTELLTLASLGFLACLLTGSWSAAEGQSNRVTGVVFLDANQNGAYDAGESGLAGVAVSDQRTVAITGDGGEYELLGEGRGVVFVVPPESYETKRFWHPVTLGRPAQTVDFPLVESDTGSEFRFIHASDVHLSRHNLERIRKLREIVDHQRAAFVLITGDLIQDALRVDEAAATSYYRLFLEEIESFPVPVWTVPGNHDIFGIERHLSLVSPVHPLYGKAMYRRFLGPTYYSFNAGGIHFVGLDSVDYDDLWYYGHIEAVQLEWLRQDLASIPDGTPVVAFNHIPFVTAGDSLHGYTDDPPAPTLIEVGGVTSFRHTVANAETSLSLLRQRGLTLALAGHGHMRESLFYETEGAQTRFHNAAALRNGTEASGLVLRSGVTVYEVRDGLVDDGVFIPIPDGLDP